MLYADEVRQVIQNLPMRIPKRVNLLMAMQGGRFQMQAKESTKWLHEINGDPVTGRSKSEVAAEIFNEDADKEQVDLGDMDFRSQSEFLLERADVEIDDPPSTGMPRSYLEGLTDTEFAIASQAARHNLVATRWEVNGTHSGTLLGQPPTGLNVMVTGVTVLKFEEFEGEDGKEAFRAIEDWTCWDLPALLAQLGIAP